MSVITIVGAGMMGSAMSIPASDNGHEVRLVGTPLDRAIIERAKKDGYHITLKRQLPENVKCYQVEELKTALEGCDLLIGGVSSFGVEWFAENVLPIIPRSLPVLSITKGLHADKDGKLVSFPDYMATKPGCDGLSLNAVGGPCISFELADRHHTVVAFCGHNKDILGKIKSLLSTEYYHINLTTDVIGIETAVAMKNAYALGVSLAIGLAESKKGEGCPEEYNPQAGLFAQSTREMYKLLEIAGGDTHEILFGAGDLYVTVFGGRTRRIGTLLGRGLTYAQAAEVLSGVTLESVAITKVVVEALEKNGKNLEEFPLLCHIYDMITKGITVDVPWDKFSCGI
ncbi:MAG: glycerol-3-phosphate dehydrogenase [Ruminococcaceae bacterium]|nr:glycerol-3-phosphate dehydrogenase [Oscillospiraceae bacterium]